MIYRKVKRVYPKSSHDKEKIFFLLIVSMRGWWLFVVVIHNMLVSIVEIHFLTFVVVVAYY